MIMDCETGCTVQELVTNGNDCNSQVLEMSHLEKSRETPAIVPGFHVCRICEALFKEISDLQDHIREHENHAEPMRKNSNYNTSKISISKTECTAQQSESEENNYKSEISEIKHSEKPREVARAVPGFHLCRYCKAPFKDISDLQVHMFGHTKSICAEQRKTSSIPGFYRCEICEALFTQYLDFEAHVRAHTQSFVYEYIRNNAGGEVYSCDVCKNTFGSEVNFEIHLLVHTESLVCRKCGKPFTKKDYLLRHLHDCTAVMLKCNVCKKQFSSRPDYEIHTKSHVANEKFSCFECNETFSQRHLFHAHVRDIHKNRVTYHCNFCDKQYRTKVSLQRHLRVHSGERPYSCHICRQKFVHKDSITHHMTVHSGRFPYVCDFCNKSFKKKSGVIHHLRRVKHPCP